MLNLYEELEGLVAALEAAAIPYALCGGLALALHGHARATKDIDLIVRPEDLPAIKSVARACGFVLESLPMRFKASGIEVQRVSKLAGAEILMLDLLLANEGLRPVFDSRQPFHWRGRTLSVVSRQGLVSMKLAAGRPQDLADLAKLTESE